MNFIDFSIAVLLANAIPHFIFGITKVRFLGLFGYTATANICYALCQCIVGIGLFHHKYGLDKLFSNGFALGSTLVLILYFIFGSLLLVKFQKK
ncbi:hypothetical protein [Sphingobacterium sp. BIGb0116]|uniref:hypothetical protein n=1 Tax=Sphingobacterium sp. BIGb0116 TaxID=2940619 RepID=UPI00216915FF|nr:hypothetical protein [Sphingobacterium sp. BIGb0116]MCS4165412.1 putative membrane protein [Sphingobacterium sp. BIGb0116]